MSADPEDYAAGRETSVFEVRIRGSIDAVRREITKTDELQGATFNAKMHTTGLGPGGAVQMRTASGKSTSMIVNTLKRIVETGRPSLGIRVLYRLFRVLEGTTPKRCRAENWPMERRG